MLLLFLMTNERKMAKKNLPQNTRKKLHMRKK